MKLSSYKSDVERFSDLDMGMHYVESLDFSFALSLIFWLVWVWALTLDFALSKASSNALSNAFSKALSFSLKWALATENSLSKTSTHAYSLSNFPFGHILALLPWAKLL